MLTKFYAKLMGLWIVLTVIGMIVSQRAAIATLNAFFADPPLMWITGVFTMLFGLAIVLTHNRWSGGPVPVIVTLYGWIALIKGLTFAWLPPSLQTTAYQSLHFDRYFLIYFVVALVIGGYLIYGGFRHEPERALEGTWPTAGFRRQ